MGSAWIVVAAAAVAASGGAYLYLFQDSAPPSSMSIQGDACSGLSASSDVWPSRPPDAERNLTLKDGENVSVGMGPGIWRAKLQSEGAAFAAGRGPRNEPTDDWTREYDLMWCHTRPETKTFLAQGDGTLHVRAWQGTGDGFQARGSWPS